MLTYFITPRIYNIFFKIIMTKKNLKKKRLNGIKNVFILIYHIVEQIKNKEKITKNNNNKRKERCKKI